jgi:hypothetical protein
MMRRYFSLRNDAREMGWAGGKDARARNCLPYMRQRMTCAVDGASTIFCSFQDRLVAVGRGAVVVEKNKKIGSIFECVIFQSSFIQKLPVVENGTTWA